MRQEKPIEQMFQEILQTLKDWGESDYSVRNFYYEGIRPIRTYYEDAGLTMYDEAFTKSIVVDLRQKYTDGIVSECICKSTCKFADMMTQYDNGFRWNRIKRGAKETLASAYYTDLLNSYYDNECKIGLRAVLTINKNITNTRHFLRWLEKCGKETLEQITLKDVGVFLTYYGEIRPCTISEMLGSLRNFYAFIKRQNVPGIDFSPALTARPSNRSKLMPTFTKSEAEEILSAVDTATPIGKRDYAVLIIAKELGIRSGDIADLKLNDIQWEKNEIRFQQRKTGAELVLPLEPVVGNAIADYILNSRPKTGDQHIFVRTRAPYRKMTAMVDIVRRYAPHGKYEKFSGFHSFRRGIASQLLNAGVAADTVKCILGHTQIDSLKPYARISDVRLKSCAIDLSGIETTREGLQ
jgi:site-specific recombinase XerD